MSTPSWEPCPRCHSSRVEIHGKIFAFVQGFALVVIGAPFGFFILSIILGPFGVIAGALLAVFGLLMMLTAPIMPRRGTCKDCKKDWTLAKAVSPSASTAHPD